MQKFGVSKEEAERILNLKNEFEVGDKVKINYEKIMNSKISNGSPHYSIRCGNSCVKTEFG